MLYIAENNPDSLEIAGKFGIHRRSAQYYLKEFKELAASVIKSVNSKGTEDGFKMKRPDKLILWLHVDKQKTDFVNHLEKPLYDFIIKLPTWIGLAYKPFYAKIEIQEKPPCWNDRRAESNHEEYEPYIKSNWSKKLTQMRKLNHNYMQVTVHGRSEGGFLSHEDYENYHRELAELNEKYLGESRKSDNLGSDFKDKEWQLKRTFKQLEKLSKLSDEELKEKVESLEELKEKIESLEKHT